VKMNTIRWGLFLLAVCVSAASWTDRGEYDLALGIRAESVPKKRLELLDRWKAQYPQTEFRQVRRELYLSTFQSLADSAGMLAVAKEMLADQPDNLIGRYWCTLLIPAGNDTSPDTLHLGESAARGLLTSLNTYFNARKKPSSILDAEWRKQKANVELLAHRALGWVQWQRADYAAAQEEFTTCLQLAPANAEISAWFGTVLGLQKQPEKQPPALWHLARAASLRGDGALPEIQQRQMSALLEHLYTSYHGGTEGLDQLRKASLDSPLPPATFNIESAGAAAFRKQLEDLDRTNPQLAAWLRIRKQLEAPDGEKYFAETLRTNPLPRLKGTLIRFSPRRKPAELIVGVRDAVSDEVVLKLSAPLPWEAELGTQLEFEGTADSFTLNPFMLTILVERNKVEGWPASRPRQ
jgi:hypothetical protein